MNNGNNKEQDRDIPTHYQRPNSGSSTDSGSRKRSLSAVKSYSSLQSPTKPQKQHIHTDTKRKRHSRRTPSMSSESSTSSPDEDDTPPMDQIVPVALLKKVSRPLSACDELFYITTKVLGLPKTLADQNYEAKMVKDIFRNCLWKWMQNTENPTTNALREILEIANLENYIDYPVLKVFDHLDEITLNEPPSNWLINKIVPLLPNLHFPRCCLGLSQAEFEQCFPIEQNLSLDKKLFQILTEWRTHNIGHNNCTIRHLSDILTKADDRYVSKEIKERIQTTIRGHLRLMRVNAQSSCSKLDISRPILIDKQSYVAEIRHNLETYYQNTLCELCPFPWITQRDIILNFDQIYICRHIQELDIRSTRGRHGRRCHQTSMNNILIHGVDEEDILKPRNIILEGEPGIGKSTVCERLAYQWAKGKSDVVRVPDFKLVLLIKVCDILKEDENIHDYLKRKLLTNYYRDVLNNMEVLILLDGYDELSGNSDVVLSLLKKLYFPAATVIVTSRLNRMPYQDFSCGFTLCGLSDSNIDEFLKKTSTSKFNSNTLKLDLKAYPVGSLLATPLFLWCFLVLGEAFYGCEQKPCGKTEFFTRIQAAITKKAMRRYEVNESDFNKALDIIQSLAYESLCLDRSYLTNALTFLTANLGFVKRCSTASKDSSVNTPTYTFTHKSIQEFLAAQYIVRQGMCNSAVIEDLLLRIPDVKDREKRKSSLIPQFLCGLLKDKSPDALTSVFAKLFDYEINRKDEIRHLVGRLRHMMDKLKPYHEAEEDIERLSYLHKIDFVCNYAESDLDNENMNMDVRIYIMEYCISKLDIDYARLLPDIEKLQGSHTYNQHATSHTSLQCMAEMKKDHEETTNRKEEIFGKHVSDCVKLDLSRCNDLCVSGLQYLLRHSNYRLAKLSVECKVEKQMVLLSNSNSVKTLTNKADFNEICIQCDQLRKTWVELDKYYDKPLDRILISRCVEVPASHLKTNTLITVSCSANVTISFIVRNIGLLVRLTVDCHDVEWTLDNTSSLETELNQTWAQNNRDLMQTRTSERSNYLLTSQLKCLTIRYTSTHGLMALLLSISYNCIETLELYQVELTSIEIMTTTACLNSSTSLRKLRLWGVKLKDRHWDSGLAVLLQNLSTLPLVRRLEELEVICHTKVGLTSFINFISKANKLYKIGYGRQKNTYEGDITDSEEVMLWNLLITDRPQVKTICLYQGFNDVIDVESSSQLLEKQLKKRYNDMPIEINPISFERVMSAIWRDPDSAKEIPEIKQMLSIINSHQSLMESTRM